jgi:hypothetical protein
MAEPSPQNLQNHVRFDPVFHFFLIPLSAATFVAAVWNAIQHPSSFSIWLALGAMLFVVAVFRIRSYSLKVQDRVIRLEERHRLTALLAEPQRARIGELTAKQLIALRFASDGEVAALAVRAINERLAPADIKKSIRDWRADNHRV